jgi:hypothetical protein
MANTLNATQEAALARLKKSAAKRNDLKARYERADAEMRADIRFNFEVEVPASKMTDYVAVGPARLYQIRDGR